MRSTSRKGTTVPDECVCTSVHMNDAVCYNNVTYVKNKRTKSVLGRSNRYMYRGTLFFIKFYIYILVSTTLANTGSTSHITCKCIY